MEIMNSGFRKKFKGPGLSLPPIHEGSSSPQRTLVPSTPSELSSPSTPLLQFPPRRPARRASIATCVSVKNEIRLQDYKTQARRDSIKSNENDERRDSLVRRFEQLQKKTAKNLVEPAFNTSKPKRRESIATVTVTPQGRRASFRSIGSRVTSLLKVKNVLHRRGSQRKSVDVEEEEIDKASEIKEMPKEPRFASTLSVEAQYAMMKGYEDVVYGYLSKSYPEYRPLLRRNRTPLTGVKVRVPDEIIDGGHRVKFGDDSDEDKEETTSEAPTDKTTQDGVDEKSLSPEISTNISKSLLSPDAKFPQTPVTPEYSSKTQGYNRLPTPPYYRSLPSSVASQRAHEAANEIARCQSLSHLVPKDKQLVMTYRYHSAMDILDQIKRNIGLHATSPRIVKGNAIEPIRDFNLWSCVWNKEFEPVRAAAI